MWGGKRLRDSQDPSHSTHLAKWNKLYCGIVTSSVHNRVIVVCAVLRPFNSCHEIPFNSAQPSLSPHTLNGSIAFQKMSLSSSLRSFVRRRPKPFEIGGRKGASLPPSPTIIGLARGSSEEGVIAIPFRNPSKVAYLPSVARSFVPY